MPRITHEPSGLIAIRALAELEQERQASERAAEAAAARADSLLLTKTAKKKEAEAEAAERSRIEEARRHDERLRAIELEEALHAAQVARLARLKTELNGQSRAPRSRARVGLWTAASLGVLGLGLALLLPAPSPRIVDHAPPLASATEDPTLREARELVASLRGELGDLSKETADNRLALAAALAAREAAPEPAPHRRPTNHKPRERPPAGKPVKPGALKICDTDDPLAEDC